MGRRRAAMPDWLPVAGSTLCFLDGDDALAPTCLQRRVEAMKSNPMVDFAVFPTWVFRATPGDTRLFWNQFTTENDLDRFLRSDMPWHTSGPIWKKTSLRQKGPWDVRALSAQDWEFHIRAIAAGLSYIKVPEPDSFWRLRGLARSVPRGRADGMCAIGSDSSKE